MQVLQGVAADVLPRLFEPFVTGRVGGTGLGLALVAKMAGLHGGGVSVESQPGQGSRFIITLPCRVAAAGMPAAGFSLTDLQGKAHSLQQYKGKIVLVNFWATWCKPCTSEMPAMQAVAQQRTAEATQQAGVRAQQLAQGEAVHQFASEIAPAVGDAPREPRPRPPRRDVIASRVAWTTLEVLDWTSRRFAEKGIDVMRAWHLDDEGTTWLKAGKGGTARARPARATPASGTP